MLIDKICELRDKLNESILTEDYKVTYELSVELDQLIAEYYKQKQQNNKVISISKTNCMEEGECSS